MRQIPVILSLMVALGHASTVQAGWTEFWDRCHLDQQRMNCWPQPFLFADRDLVRQPLIAMTEAGWRSENTLSDHLFHPDTNALTQAGTLKVRWILTQTPAHRRSLFVLRGATPEATAARLASVQDLAAQIPTAGPPVQVLLTDLIPAGGSGEYFDAVNRQLNDTIPQPRLPPAAGPSTGSSN